MDNIEILITDLLERKRVLEEAKAKYEALRAELKTRIDRKMRYRKDGYLVYYRYPSYRKTFDYLLALKQHFNLKTAEIEKLRDKYYRNTIVSDELVITKQRTAKGKTNRNIKITGDHSNVYTHRESAARSCASK